MPMQTTIIPSRIDANSVDNEYIVLDSNEKITLGEDYQKDLVNSRKEISEHEIEIIELQANASVTPNDHDTLISDTFSDSNGYENSVDIGNSDTTFDTNKYKRENESRSDNSHGEGFASSGNFSGYAGFKVVANKNCLIYSVTKNSGCTADTAYIFDSFGSLLSSGSFSGDIAVLDTPVEISNGSTYYVATKNDDDSTYTQIYGGTSNFPFEFTDINFTAYIDGTDPTSWNNEDTSYKKNIVTITTQDFPQSKTTKINLPTISGTVIATQLILNCPERETGDSITYNLSDGSNEDSGLAEETKNDITNLIDNPTNISINLNPKGNNATDGYPSVKSYCLKLWKS